MSVDLATLGLEVRSDGVVVASDRLRELQNQGRGAETATNRMTRSFGEAQRASRLLSTALAGLGVSLSLRGIQSLVTQTADWAATLQDTADGLGLTTTELQRYREAAREATVETSALDNGLQRLNRRVGQARDGKGELAEVARQLNLDLSSTDAAFRGIADAMANAQDPNEAARIGFAAFGREVDNLLPLLRQGTSQIDAWGDQAERAGRVMDAELVRRGAQAAAQINRINSTLQTSLRAGLLSGFAGGLGDIEEILTSEEFQAGMRFLGEALGTIASLGSEAVAEIGALVALLGDPSWDNLANVGVLGLARRTFDSLTGASGSPEHQSAPPQQHAAGAPAAAPGLDRAGADLVHQLQLQVDVQWELNNAIRYGREAYENTSKEIERINASLDFQRDLERQILSQVQGRSQLTDEEFDHVVSMTAAYRELYGELQNIEAEFERIVEQQRLLDELRAVANPAQREREFHAERMEALSEIDEELFEHARERNELLQALEEEHQRQLTALHQQGLLDREGFTQMSLRRQTAAIFGELATITAGVAQHNRQLFELNKVAGIANAILNTYEGVSRSLAAYPWPLAGAMAAAHLAAGMAQVQAIRNTSFEGGGSGTAPSIGGSTPATPVSPVDQGGPSQRIYVEFEGGDDTRLSLRDLRAQIRRIREENPDAELVF